jgi:hypothetical protein
MKRKYLIDANLPKYFGLWQKIEAEYVPDTLWSDEKYGSMRATTN